MSQGEPWIDQILMSQGEPRLPKMPPAYYNRLYSIIAAVGPESGEALIATLAGESPRIDLPEMPIAEQADRPEPVSMLTLPEQYRVRGGDFATKPGSTNGLFTVTGGKIRFGSIYAVIASASLGWDHISVSVRGEDRCPSWGEMCYIKGLFFHEDATAVQYHPAKSDYVNDHPFVLHIWRSKSGFPLPPKVFV